MTIKKNYPSITIKPLTHKKFLRARTKPSGECIKKRKNIIIFVTQTFNHHKTIILYSIFREAKMQFAFALCIFAK